MSTPITSQPLKTDADIKDFAPRTSSLYDRRSSMEHVSYGRVTIARASERLPKRNCLSREERQRSFWDRITCCCFNGNQNNQRRIPVLPVRGGGRCGGARWVEGDDNEDLSILYYNVLENYQESTRQGHEDSGHVEPNDHDSNVHHETGTAADSVGSDCGNDMTKVHHKGNDASCPEIAMSLRGHHDSVYHKQRGTAHHGSSDLDSKNYHGGGTNDIVGSYCDDDMTKVLHSSNDASCLVTTSHYGLSHPALGHHPSNQRHVFASNYQASSHHDSGDHALSHHDVSSYHDSDHHASSHHDHDVSSYHDSDYQDYAGGGDDGD